MSDWFDSEERVARLARASWIVTGSAYVLALIGWPITLFVAVPCAIFGTVAILMAVFFSLRREHLRELERERQNPRVR